MLDRLIYLWLAALPLMGSPGPATISLAALAAAFGSRSCLSYLAGIIVGTVGVLLMIAMGATGIILASPRLAGAVTLLAAIYILYLAFRIATAPPLSRQASSLRPPSFPAGFLLAVTNPKAFAAIGAVYAGHRILPADLTGDAMAKIAALAVVIVFVNTIWMFFGSTFSSLLTNERAARVINITFASMLVASVAVALFYR